MMNGEKFGGKHSSFERLVPSKSGWNAEDDNNNARDANSDPGTLSRRISKPKPFRPPVGNGHSKSERTKDSDDENKDHSPVKHSVQDHKSAWTRIPKQSHQVSSPNHQSPPREENTAPEVSKSDSYVKTLQQAPKNWNSPWSSDVKASNQNEENQENSEKYQRQRFLKQMEVLQALTSQNGPEDQNPNLKQNDRLFEGRASNLETSNLDLNELRENEFQREREGFQGPRPKAMRNLGKGLHDREEAVMRQRYRDEKEESDRTQSSREETHSGNSKRIRRISSHEEMDPKYMDSHAHSTRKGDIRRGSKKYAPEEFPPATSRGREREKGGQERLPVVNGSLDMFQDADRDNSPPGDHPIPYFMSQQAQNSQRPASNQQMYKLLEEVLRGQAPALPNSLPLLNSEPPINPGLAPLMHGSVSMPYTSLPPRLPGLEYRGSMGYGQSGDLDNYAKMASRRWSPMGSYAPEPNSLSAGNIAQMLPNLPSNLTNAESQALLQALQQKHQANEMEAMANVTIQALLAISANRDAQNGIMPRKRKIGDFYDQPAKRHSSLTSETELYNSFHNPSLNGPQQICAECGTTNTPTWRRHGKRLMCNACGLRRSRSLRSARTNQGQNPSGGYGSPEMAPHASMNHRSDDSGHMRMGLEGMRLADLEAKPELYQN